MLLWNMYIFIEMNNTDVGIFHHEMIGFVVKSMVGSERQLQQKFGSKCYTMVRHSIIGRRC
jgi:hypothetical protein